MFSKSNELAEKLLRHVPRFGFDFRRSWLARDASLRDLLHEVTAHEMQVFNHLHSKQDFVSLRDAALDLKTKGDSSSQLMLLTLDSLSLFQADLS